MNVFAIYAVTEHIADLMAEAADNRTANHVRGTRDAQGRIRRSVASLVSSTRERLNPPVATLTGHPYRG
jgi:hypothetical protein